MAAKDAVAGVSYPQLFLAGCVLLVAYVLGVAIYRLYFHPLAKYPGPFWAKLSTIPSWLHTIKQDRHIWLYSLQEKYGMF
jgi:hypothetical protein